MSNSENLIQISEDDWNQWKSNPVTNDYLQYLQNSIDDGLNKILNLDAVSDKGDLEKYAIKSLSLRYFVDGIAQAADLESIAEDVVIKNKEVDSNYGY